MRPMETITAQIHRLQPVPDQELKLHLKRHPMIWKLLSSDRLKLRQEQITTAQFRSKVWSNVGATITMGNWVKGIPLNKDTNRMTWVNHWHLPTWVPISLRLKSLQVLITPVL